MPISFSLTDDDINDVFTFSLTGSPHVSYFSVDTNGDVYVAKSIDYDVATEPKYVSMRKYKIRDHIEPWIVHPGIDNPWSSEILVSM